MEHVTILLSKLCNRVRREFEAHNTQVLQEIALLAKQYDLSPYYQSIPETILNSISTLPISDSTIKYPYNKSYNWETLSEQLGTHRPSPSGESVNAPNSIEIKHSISANVENDDIDDDDDYDSFEATLNTPSIPPNPTSSSSIEVPKPTPQKATNNSMDNTTLGNIDPAKLFINDAFHVFDYDIEYGTYEC